LHAHRLEVVTPGGRVGPATGKDTGDGRRVLVDRDGCERGGCMGRVAGEVADRQLEVGQSVVGVAE
jgi:hypothetical protein